MITTRHFAEFMEFGNEDFATIYLDLQASGTELQEADDVAEVYLDLQTSGVDIYGGNADEATIPLVLTPSAADVADFVDSATILFDLQGSGVDAAEFVDSAEIYMEFSVVGGECFVTWSGEFLGEGEAFIEFFGDAWQEWTGTESTEWDSGTISIEGEHC